jgi:hypothetical protein
MYYSKNWGVCQYPAYNIFTIYLAHKEDFMVAVPKHGQVLKQPQPA